LIQEVVIALDAGLGARHLEAASGDGSDAVAHLDLSVKVSDHDPRVLVLLFLLLALGALAQAVDAVLGDVAGEAAAVHSADQVDAELLQEFARARWPD